LDDYSCASKLESETDYMKKKLTHSQKSPAQAMVEFALVLPILLLLIYGLLEVGRLLFIYSSVVSAARQAARYASTTGVNASGTFRYRDCDGMRDAAQRVAFIDDFPDADIEIWHDEGEGVNEVSYCSSGTSFDTTFTPTTGNINRVRVRVHTQYTPIVPIVPLQPFVIESISARTILVSVPIVITAAPQGWNPNATPIPPDTATATITFTPTLTLTPTITVSPTATVSPTTTGTATPTFTPVDTATATGTFTPVPPPGAFNKISPSGAITQTTLVTLQWQASAGATSYDICFDQTNDNACDNDNWTTIGNATSYQASTNTSTTYYWHVRAVNANPTMTYSNGSSAAFWSFTTAATTACTARADPLVVNGKTITTQIYNKGAVAISISQITITWNNSSAEQELSSILLGSTSISISASNKKVSPFTASGLSVSVPADIIGITLQITFKKDYIVNGNESILVNFADPCSALVLDIR
jgi:Flp pilus assembly protein TadG